MTTGPVTPDGQPSSTGIQPADQHRPQPDARATLADDRMAEPPSNLKPVVAPTSRWNGFVANLRGTAKKYLHFRERARKAKAQAPRWGFFKEYLTGVVTAFATTVVARLFVFAIVWTNNLVPIGSNTPIEVRSYSPWEFTRVVITILDNVALAYLIVTSVVMLIDLVASLFVSKD